MATSSTSEEKIDQTKRTTKHITTACLSCRKKKIRCDGGNPSCSNCSLYSQECVYQHGVDKRKIASKDRLAALQSYCETLESILEANSLELPPVPEGTFLDKKPRLKSQSAPKGTALSQNGGSDTYEIVNLDQYSKFQDYSDYSRNVMEDPQSAESSPAVVHAQDAMPALFDTVDYTGAMDDAPTPLMDQLASRMGSLQVAEDGQLRFYGATSNLHILASGASPGTPAPSVNEDYQAILEKARLGQYVDEELEDHLLKLYFCWEDPSIHVVDEEIYFRERYRARKEFQFSHFYSEVLTNAMCSVGAAITPRRCLELPENLVEFFAARSKALLDVEMDSPNLSTVQALVILSGVEALLTRDARGWLYSGMAIRLATDLGLHIDTQVYRDAGIISHEEAKLRSIVFWGSFIHERMWSVYVGRPTSLADKNITIPPPSGDSITGAVEQFWEPYIDEGDGSNAIRIPHPIEELTKFNASLCAKMTAIREILYSDLNVNIKGLAQLHTFVATMRSELWAWHESLPESLRVDDKSITRIYLPHVLQLHMQYHCIMIITNRPFFSPTNRSAVVESSEAAACRLECTKSASAISSLLQTYRRLYTLRRINIQAVHLIFTASLIHVCNAYGSPESKVKNAACRDLEVCCQALQDIGHGYKNASRGLNVVKRIELELLNWSKSNIKRSSAGAEDDHSEGFLSKRRRLTENSAILGPENEQHGLTTQDENAFDVFGDTGIDTDAEFSLDSLFWTELTNTERQYLGM